MEKRLGVSGDRMSLLLSLIRWWKLVNWRNYQAMVMGLLGVDRGTPTGYNQDWTDALGTRLGLISSHA